VSEIILRDKLIFILIKLSYQAVESMRNGMTPEEASKDAIQRIVKKYPNFTGALVAMDKFGNHSKYLTFFFF
jgi:hypothetical protein